jgi:penicillin-binding protein 2
MINHPNEIARRARLVSFALVGVFLFLGAAFFRTQILQYKSYALQSERNRLVSVPISAPRGTIYDRNGQIIAENIPGFEVSLLSESLDSLKAALQRFSELVPLEPETMNRLTSVRTFDRNRPTLVLSNATPDEVALLEEHKITEFPGLVVEAAPRRKYPDGPAVSAFIGYTRQINEAQLAAEKFKGYKPGQQVGELGLEEQYEGTLRGREGRRFREQNSLGQTVLRSEEVRPMEKATKGEDLPTNIDMDLQRFIADSIFRNDLGGGVLVMNPESGEVHALYSGPAFDPNDFIGGISRDKYGALLNDPRRPMWNKVTKARYPPASAYKLVTAVLGLEAGLVSLDDHMPVPCSGSYTMGNQTYHCWKPEGHGSLTLAQAVEVSCNVYFFQLGQRLGLTRLMEGGNRLGFASKTGIDLPNEVNSILPADLEYYRQQFQGRFSAAGEVLNLSIGQGSADQTVANMARFYSALAYDGYAATPQIIRGMPPQRTKLFDLTPEQHQGLRDALKLVVTSGTAAGSRINWLDVAGKTGTAQNPHGLAHGWFVGFAPADKPTLLVAVLLEHGEHGSDAARVARDIFAFHFKDRNVLIRETGG